MRPEESFLQQPVRSLQTMLRVLSRYDQQYPQVIPDGIYGPSTAEAVTAFQRIHGLSVTGIADQSTWDTVVAVYEPANIHLSPAQPVEILLDFNETAHRGDSGPYIYLVQAILLVLAEAYGSIGKPVVNGTLDEATADALSAFQSLVGLPTTGTPDKHTWKHLALHFPLAASRAERRGETGSY